MSIKVTLDMKKVKGRIEKGKTRCKEKVTEAVVQFGNEYCPEDQGDLKDSALYSSKPHEGLAIWDREYAERLYKGNGLNFSKDKNPNATYEWADKGVNNNRKEIDRIAQKSFMEGMS